MPQAAATSEHTHSFHVIPAQAGIQGYIEFAFLDPRFRGGDEMRDRVSVVRSAVPV